MSAKNTSKAQHSNWGKGNVSESDSDSARLVVDGLHRLLQLLESLLWQGMLILIWVQQLSEPPKVLYYLVSLHLKPKWMNNTLRNLHPRYECIHWGMNEFVYDKNLILIQVIDSSFIRFQVVNRHLLRLHVDLFFKDSVVPSTTTTRAGGLWRLPVWSLLVVILALVAFFFHFPFGLLKELSLLSLKHFITFMFLLTKLSLPFFTFFPSAITTR